MKHIVILDQILSKTIIFILPSHWSDPPTLAGVIWTFLFLVKIFIILTYFRWAFLKWLNIVKKGPQNQNKWPWYEQKTLIFQFSSKKHVIRISILHTSKSPLSVVLKIIYSLIKIDRIGVPTDTKNDVFCNFSSFIPLFDTCPFL